jgi:Zn-dependent protease/predicted transcriptional regulator
MHELGHALTARRFGIETRDIILLPIGGVARLERMPEEPRQELLIAVAGPAVNVVLAAIFWMLMFMLGDRPTFGYSFSGSGGFLGQMLAVNITLILFNALPAFPMDGGRVLRALLAMRMNYARATRYAAAVGKVFAALFVLFGLMESYPFLVVIGIFVWLGASGEASQTQVKLGLQGATIDDIIIRDVLTLAPDDPLQKGVDSVLAGFQQDFPVVVGGVLQGLLTREDLVRALDAQGRTGRVADAMRSSVPTASPSDAITDVFARLQSAGLRSIPVVAEGQFIGVITTENIAEYLMLRSAMNHGNT